MGEKIVEALVTGAPAAVVAIVVICLFLKRMKESQVLGHAVADRMASDHRVALTVVVEGHEKAMDSVASRIDDAATKQENLAGEVRSLCTEIRLQNQTPRGGHS